MSNLSKKFSKDQMEAMIEMLQKEVGKGEKSGVDMSQVLGMVSSVTSALAALSGGKKGKGKGKGGGPIIPQQAKDMMTGLMTKLMTSVQNMSSQSTEEVKEAPVATEETPATESVAEESTLEDSGVNEESSTTEAPVDHVEPENLVLEPKSVVVVEGTSSEQAPVVAPQEHTS
jgi:hypothetical protein